MTTAADDSAVEDAFEAILAGRPVPEGAAGLAAFTGAVRASATAPGRPNAALAELLATGLLTDQSSPSVRTAVSAGSAPERRRSRVRTRRRPAMILSALFVKFLSAGAVAQAATGATVAVVAFTGVGAVGALPDPVQDTFATVVADLTPLEPPASEETTDQVVAEETAVEEVVPEEATTEDVAEVPTDAGGVEDLEAQVRAWALEGPADGQSISAWASEGSKADVKRWLRARGMNYGNVVSAWTSGKGFTHEELSALGAQVDEPTETPTEVVTEPDAGVVVEDVPEAEQAEVPATEDRGSRTNGKAYGNGNGNGGGKAHGNGNGNGHGNGNGGGGGGGGRN
jgi:uncharacterized membrane protein YgcG